MGKRFMRRSLAVAGILAAAALSGCQSGGGHYAHTGVVRGDVTGTMPTSPAFAQINAGRNLPMMQAANGPMTSMPANQMMASGQPIMGSGGMVYPVGYTTSGPMPMHTSQAQMPMMGQSMPMSAQQQMTMQSMPMTVQPQMAMQSMPAPTMSSLPTTTSIPAMTTPTGNGQQTLLLVQGPNGPQYVVAEVLSSSPLPTSNGTPVTTTLGPAPTTVAAPEPIPPATPTFTAPPPATVPMPSLTPTAPPEISFKAPENLPHTVSAKPPTGPVLPVAGTTTPGLGSYPAAPAVSPTSGPKLPASSGVTDDDIPSAPVFLPSAK